MTFPNNAWEHAESAPEICRNRNESTFWQNIGNSRFTYTSNHHKLHIYTSHIHQTTISFTYTLHIYIKPPHKLHIYTSHIHQNHHKLHIYIKRPQASHIHQTQASHIHQKPQANKGKYG